MGLETVTWIGDLNPLWPLGSDDVGEGDDHLRNVKTALTNQFPSIGAGSVTLTYDQINNAIIGSNGGKMTENIIFSDNTKGVQWELLSGKTVTITADESTIDAIDYEYLKLTMAGIIVNADDAATDSGFVACMVDKAGTSVKPAIIGFNDVTTLGMICGMEYDVNTDIMYLGNPNAQTLTQLTLRKGAQEITFDQLFALLPP